MLKRKPKKILSCSVNGVITSFQTKEEIELSIRRADFMKRGLTASLYLYAMAVKKQVDNFKKQKSYEPERSISSRG